MLYILTNYYIQLLFTIGVKNVVSFMIKLQWSWEEIIVVANVVLRV